MTISNKTFLKSLFAFFIFGSLFPTFRVWMIGSETSSGIYQLIISVLPEVFSIVLLALLCIHIVKQEKISNTRLTFTLFDKIIASFFIVNIILGFIIGGDMRLSLYAFRLTYLPLIFYLFGRYVRPFDKTLLDDFFHWALYWILAISFIGIILYFGFPESTADMIRWSGGRLMSYHIPRMTSIFWTPVVFASFVSLGALFTYFNIQLKNELKYYIFFAIFCTCLFFCVSRGPLFTFLIGFFSLTFIYKQWKQFLICIGIIIVLYLFFTLTIDSFDKVLMWIFSSTIDTMMVKHGVTRVELFFRTIHDLQTNPLGYGFGKAGIIATRFFTEETPGISFYSTDCWYLKIACETGLIGIISYLILIGSHGWNMLAYLRENRKETLLLFLFLFFILFNTENIVHNLPDFYLLANFYWLTVGFSQNYISKKSD